MIKRTITTHSFASLSRTMQARLMKLHQKLLAIWRDSNPNKRFPNATELGEFLEVTPRTVYRFIEIMQVDLRLPVELVRERGGYGYTQR